MSRFNESLPEPSRSIMMLQQTVEDLFNNSMTINYYTLLKTMMEEGYTINFKGYSKAGDTEIKDLAHLKNYINHIQGTKIL